MKSSHLLGVLLCGCLWASPGTAGDTSHPPTQKHVKAGVTCHDCHQEENPKKAATEESCEVCHGDYPAMAEVTKNLPVNPHKPPPAKHPKPFACTECHRQHKPPVAKCLECHPTFKMNLK